MQYKRIMALDYGDVRIGIAFSDLLQTIASPYDTYTRVNLETDLNYLLDLAKKHGLLTTGGSDFHGMYSDTPRAVGSTTAPDDAVAALLAYKQKLQKKG